METIVISGASGFIGSHLKDYLSKSYNIRTLTTQKKKAYSPNEFYWNPLELYIPEEALQNSHIIINLSGANIAANRWNKAYKQEIITSRTLSTQTLLRAINTNTSIHTYIGTSAIGFYGLNPYSSCFEDSAVGNDFLATTCKQLEDTITQFAPTHIRTVILRLGIVLDSNQGFIKEITKTLPMRIIPILGTGKQTISWIHIFDICKIFAHSISHSSISGIYNAVSSDNKTYIDFIKQIQVTIGKQIFTFGIPNFLLKIALGEISSVITSGSDVSNNKIKQTGFTFTYTHLQESLKDCLRNK